MAKDRSEYIGGSDAGPICGYGRFRDAIDVWREKTGKPTESVESTEIERGSELEDDAVDKLKRETEYRVEKEQGFYSSEEYGYLGGTVDGKIWKRGDTPGLLEVKVPRTEVCRHIENHGMHEEYVAQVQHYFSVTHFGWGVIAILDPNDWKLHTFEVKPNEKLISRIRTEEIQFWNKYVRKDEKPPLENESDPLPMPDVEGKSKMVHDAEWDQHAEKLAKYRKLKNVAESLEEEHKEWFKEEMKDRGIDKAQVPGKMNISYSKCKGQISWKDTLYEVADKEPLEKTQVVRILENHDVDQSLIRLVVNKAKFNPFDLKVRGKEYRQFTPTPQEEVDLSDILS